MCGNWLCEICVVDFHALFLDGSVAVLEPSLEATTSIVSLSSLRQLLKSLLLGKPEPIENSESYFWHVKNVEGVES